jgi:hypothetical protein
MVLSLAAPVATVTILSVRELVYLVVEGNEPGVAVGGIPQSCLQNCGAVATVGALSADDFPS